MRPFASRNVPSGRRAAIVVCSRVALIRTGRPGLRSTGISASVSAARRSVVPERGNSTIERSTVERRHASDSQLGIETVGEVVPCSPGAGRILFHDETPRWPLRPPGLECSAGLRRDDVLGARALRALADGERHAVAFAHGVERRARAGGLVKEVFGAVRRDDEAEALVRDALDGAGGWAMCRSSEELAEIGRVLGWFRVSVAHQSRIEAAERQPGSPA